MASSLSDILSAVQNGVIALNNMAVQIKGSFNNILSRFVTDEANIATNTTNIAANAAAIAALQVLPYKIVSFTRVLSVASGNASVTGVGFRPRLILFQTGISGGAFWSSAGMTDGTSNTSMEWQTSAGASAAFFQSGIAGIQREDVGGGLYQTFVLSSFDADGFTLAWTKVGIPTVTANISATCFR